VSGYTKEVRKYSQLGANGFPLEWVASGRIDQPKPLKGNAVTGPIPFSRTERSFFVPKDPELPTWEQGFGDLSPDGRVVIFLGDGYPSQPLTVLPSGSQEQDLIELIQSIVEIQAIHDPMEQRQAWLRFLTRAPSDEARRVALRSLVHAGVDWNEMARSLRTLLSNAGLSGSIKAFAFGLVAFYVTEGKWDRDANATVDLLCRTFSVEMDSRLELEYLQSIKVLLRYTVEEPRVESRQPLQKRILDALEQRAKRGLEDPTLEEEYKRIRAQYENR